MPVISDVRIKVSRSSMLSLPVVASKRARARYVWVSRPPRISVTTVMVRSGRFTVSLPKLALPRQWGPAWMAMGAIITLSFIAGMVTVWQTQLSSADAEGNGAVAGATTGGLVKLMQPQQSDLNIVADLLPLLIQENRHEPTPEEIASQERKRVLREYLNSKRSPLASDEAALDALLASNNMEMILAISFVEGNFCRHQVAHNCSGIGGSKMKKYDTFAGWVKDFDALLERRYKGLKVEQFIGYYVVPGSENWKNGVYQILDELKHKGIK